jgi:CHASE2 domain-containing sensor protein
LRGQRGANAVVALLLSLSVILCRFAGWFEPWELVAYDRYLNWRLTAARHDPYVTLILVTENDLENPACQQWQYPNASDVEKTQMRVCWPLTAAILGKRKSRGSEGN